jgi:hypothetical protein
MTPSGTPRALASLCVGLAIASSCTVESVIVQRVSDEVAGATSAGAAVDLGGSGNGNVTAGGATGDPYRQDQYDWCQPPLEDTWLATSNQGLVTPREVVGSCAIPQTQYWSITLLVDRSLSMNQQLPSSRMTKWVAVHNAIEFLGNEATGFVQQLSLMTFAASDAFDTDSNCAVASYVASPALYQHPPKLSVKAMLPLLEKSPAMALLRPTAVAVRAALADARAKALAYGGDSRPTVVLITDGEPYGCASGNEAQRLLDQISADNPVGSADFVPIHVVQLGNAFDLTELAKVGGTEAPFVISGGQIDLQLVKILRRILFPPPPRCESLCSIAKPNLRAGARLAFSVTLESAYYFGNSVNNALAVPQVGSSADCAHSPTGGFWVLDSGADFSIGVCPCTCAALGSAFKTTTTVYRGN